MKITEIEGLKIRDSEQGDVEAILGLIAQAPDALLTVTPVEIQSWIAAGHSLVAEDSGGKIVGHQGLGYWSASRLRELRAAYVGPEFRGKGLNTLMKAEMILRSESIYPGTDIIGFTEAASKSRHILERMGFEELPLAQVPSELFGICPENCCMRNGFPCGCKVYIMRK